MTGWLTLWLSLAVIVALLSLMLIAISALFIADGLEKLTRELATIRKEMADEQSRSDNG
jgi:hypothetical protein